MERLVELINSDQIKNVVVAVGAGISVAAGIPDFRSPSIGLYASIKEMGHFNFRSPTFVFDIGVFRKDPRPFWWIFGVLWPRADWPLPTDFHYLISLLHSKGKLLRCYSQNVDGLELMANLPEDKVVYAHGVLHPAHCLNCHAEVPLKHCIDAIQPNIAQKQGNYNETIVPTCPKCGGNHVKPDVVFFGENLPRRFFDLYDRDLSNADLLIVSGTSLEVYPFASIPRDVPNNTPRFLINRDRVREYQGALQSIGTWFKELFSFGFKDCSPVFDFSSNRDYFIGGDLQDAAKDLINRLGWEEEYNQLKTETEHKQHPLLQTIENEQAE